MFSTIFAIVMLLFLACNDDKKLRNEKAKKIMEIHDAVMPKMDDIMQLKEKMQVILADTNLSYLHARAAELIINLEEADESMMYWMREYDEPNPTMKTEEAMAYFEQQEIAITQVSDNMLRAIREAEEFIESKK
jgi:bisphosphoglycerate-dependent phosphoglycerate mutase